MPIGVTVYGVPLTRIAIALGNPLVKNSAALGALCAATDLFPAETFLTALRQALGRKSALIALNEEAFERGARAVCEPSELDEGPKCPRMQADGVPCDSVDAQCDECAERTAYLEPKGI